MTAIKIQERPIETELKQVMYPDQITEDDLDEYIIASNIDQTIYLLTTIYKTSKGDVYQWVPEEAVLKGQNYLHYHQRDTIEESVTAALKNNHSIYLFGHINDYHKFVNEINNDDV